MSDWLPIETAPKDGQEILVCRQGLDEVFIARWCSDSEFRTTFEHSDHLEFWNTCRWHYADFVAGAAFDEEPTHWMPLPVAC